MNSNDHTISIDEIMSALPLVPFLEKRDVVFKNKAGEMWACCPIHNESTPSFKVQKCGQKFKCFGCGAGGSVIDLQMALSGSSSKGDAIRALIAEMGVAPAPRPQNGNGGQKRAKDGPKKIVAEYSYTDEIGNELFQCIRYEPKDFHQRHRGKDGQWIYNLDGCRRVLYNLPRVLVSPIVILVEGEKDADTVNGAGLVATCNPMGAGKWIEAYVEFLKDKEIILVPDSDKNGREHATKVLEMIAGKVKSATVVNLPSPFKDITDYAASFPDVKAAMCAFIDLASAAPKLFRGIDVPLLSMEELRGRYETFVKQSYERSLSLGGWLPSLGRCVRPALPGDVILILGGTGVGKTMVLQNIMCSITLPTVFFEIELCDALTYERFASIQTKRSGTNIFQTIYHGGSIEPVGLAHVETCVMSKIGTPDIERIIGQYELKTGVKCAVAMIDYVGLIRGAGSRYERMSDIAEELRIIAKTTGTIIVVASQVKRKEGEEVFLTDGKDSGSLENSASLVLGLWRDAADENRLTVKVLKNTKGFPGKKISCLVKGDTMTVLEIVEEHQAEMI